MHIEQLINLWPLQPHIKQGRRIHAIPAVQYIFIYTVKFGCSWTTIFRTSLGSNALWCMLPWHICGCTNSANISPEHRLSSFADIVLLQLGMEAGIRHELVVGLLRSSVKDIMQNAWEGESEGDCTFLQCVWWLSEITVHSRFDRELQIILRLKPATKRV